MRFEVDASAVAGSLVVGSSYSYQIGQVNGLAGGGQTYLDPSSFSVTGFAAQSISATVTPGGAVYLNFTPAPVPEPGPALALAAGGLAVGAVRRGRRPSGAGDCG